MLSRLTAIPIICAIWLVNLLFRLLPVSICWNIGECLGSLCCTIMPERRRVVRNNLRIVAKQHPEITVTETLVRQVFRRSIANLTCSLKTYGMTPEQLSKHVEIEIPDQYMQDMESKRGTIVCLAHMGNWEILTKIIVSAAPDNTEFGAVYRPLDNKVANKYVAGEREKHGCTMFPKGTPMTTLSQFVKKGGNLGILADQRAGKRRKYERPFFGEGSARSKLPAILHRRSGCPLYMAAIYSDTPGKWKIKLFPVEVSSEDTEEIVAAITASYEQIFREHLIDVFWLHTYWKKPRVKPRKPASN
ncbi:lipid A biosynthesis lauroyltransferase [Rubritalea halochordaticola]|uniref:Lipid A biosynthesis lauroyltransferase n=1 Tax=Rubritalea halochordaticola TaxID=714537 RepID=A0ABP9UYG9_9BACT